MDNEWTGGGAAFDGIDARDCFRVKSAGTEAVDGLRGKGDQASHAEQLGGSGNFDGAGADGWGHGFILDCGGKASTSEGGIDA